MGFVDKKVHYLSRKLQVVARAPTYGSVVRGGLWWVAVVRHVWLKQEWSPRMGGREEGPVGSVCPIERVRWGAFSTGSWGSGDLHHGCG